jgi:hypothetical protein
VVADKAVLEAAGEQAQHRFGIASIDVAEQLLDPPANDGMVHFNHPFND